MSEQKTDKPKEANPLDAQYGDWAADFNKERGGDGNGKSKNKIEWMKFDKPGKYKVRLIGKYVKYLKHYKPFGKGVRVITHQSYKPEDPAWQAGFYPAETYVIHVIDRNDGKLKLLDKGRKLFESFFDYGTANNINPAGPEAPNFEIKVEWPNGQKNRAKYTAVAAGGPAPLTPEEKELVRANHVELGAIYRATPLAKIKEAWDAVPVQYRTPKRDDEGDNTSEAPAKDNKDAKEKGKPAIEESMGSAPAEDDDLFGGSGNAGETKDESTGW
jgi:hypothetical protein